MGPFYYTIMHINENTKISKIIADNPESIEKIVSISKHFEKLRIAILRKTLASRVTIKQAAKIGGVSVQDFFEKLAPLGFTYDNSLENKIDLEKKIKEYKNEIHFFENIVDLDVREMLRQNKDPFNLIMDSLEKLPENGSLNIINTFEPIPLINILSKKGYVHQVNYIEKMLVHTYFKKQHNINNETINIKDSSATNQLEQIINRYKNRIKEIDVRSLEMPLPMSTILNELILLPNDFLLFVHHKKVPKFLFPELAERGFQWHIEEIKDGDVKLFIFK